MENNWTKPRIATIHYAEIALKGKNRIAFENRLIENISKKLKGTGAKFSRESGIIVGKIKIPLELEAMSGILRAIPGIAYFSFAVSCDREVPTIQKTVIQLLESRQFESFRINAKRRDKKYPVKSIEVNAKIGEAVALRFKKKARMKNPDLEVKIEITDKNAYISFADAQGVGGMPTDESQKVVSLLSGGYDSPVAAYLMMKRGCSVILVHFQNRLQITDIVEDKVVRLGRRLAAFQTATQLYIIPFEDIQREIIMKVPSQLRMLIYRKFMIHISAKIADLNGARFLVTGDSLSQVASQTFDNLAATYHNSPKHILAPLIGLDKREIMDIAHKIGTYEISVLPYGDCCSFFIPRHPELHASPRELKRLEDLFDIPALTNTVVAQAKISRWD
jgi:thiamine biosynthesis protein ThiI